MILSTDNLSTYLYRSVKALFNPTIQLSEKSTYLLDILLVSQIPYDKDKYNNLSNILTMFLEINEVEINSNNKKENEKLDRLEIIINLLKNDLNEIHIKETEPTTIALHDDILIRKMLDESNLNVINTLIKIENILSKLPPVEDSIHTLNTILSIYKSLLNESLEIIFVDHPSKIETKNKHTELFNKIINLLSKDSVQSSNFEEMFKFNFDVSTINFEVLIGQANDFYSSLTADILSTLSSNAPTSTYSIEEIILLLKCINCIPFFKKTFLFTENENMKSDLNQLVFYCDVYGQAMIAQLPRSNAEEISMVIRLKKTIETYIKSIKSKLGNIVTYHFPINQLTLQIQSIDSAIEHGEIYFEQLKQLRIIENKNQEYPMQISLHFYQYIKPILKVLFESKLQIGNISSLNKILKFLENLNRISNEILSFNGIINQNFNGKISEKIQTLISQYLITAYNQNSEIEIINSISLFSKYGIESIYNHSITVTIIATLEFIRSNKDNHSLLKQELDSLILKLKSHRQYLELFHLKNHNLLKSDGVFDTDLFNKYLEDIYKKYVYDIRFDRIRKSKDIEIDFQKHLTCILKVVEDYSELIIESSEINPTMCFYLHLILSLAPNYENIDNADIYNLVNKLYANCSYSIFLDEDISIEKNQILNDLIQKVENTHKLLTKLIKEPQENPNTGPLILKLMSFLETLFQTWSIYNLQNESIDQHDYKYLLLNIQCLRMMSNLTGDILIIDENSRYYRQLKLMTNTLLKEIIKNRQKFLKISEMKFASNLILKSKSQSKFKTIDQLENKFEPSEYPSIECFTVSSNLTFEVFQKISKNLPNFAFFNFVHNMITSELSKTDYDLNLKIKSFNLMTEKIWSIISKIQVPKSSKDVMGQEQRISIQNTNQLFETYNYINSNLKDVIDNLKKPEFKKELQNYQAIENWIKKNKPLFKKFESLGTSLNSNGVKAFFNISTAVSISTLLAISSMIREHTSNNSIVDKNTLLYFNMALHGITNDILENPTSYKITSKIQQFFNKTYGLLVPSFRFHNIDFESEFVKQTLLDTSETLLINEANLYAGLMEFEIEKNNLIPTAKQHIGSYLKKFLSFDNLIKQQDSINSDDKIKAMLICLKSNFNDFVSLMSDYQLNKLISNELSGFERSLHSILNVDIQKSISEDYISEEERPIKKEKTPKKQSKAKPPSQNISSNSEIIDKKIDLESSKINEKMSIVPHEEIALSLPKKMTDIANFSNFEASVEDPTFQVVSHQRKGKTSKTQTSGHIRNKAIENYGKKQPNKSITEESKIRNSKPASEVVAVTTTSEIDNLADAALKSNRNNQTQDSNSIALPLQNKKTTSNTSSAESIVSEAQTEKFVTDNASIQSSACYLPTLPHKKKKKPVRTPTISLAHSINSTIARQSDAEIKANQRSVSIIDSVKPLVFTKANKPSQEPVPSDLKTVEESISSVKNSNSESESGLQILPSRRQSDTAPTEIVLPSILNENIVNATIEKTLSEKIVSKIERIEYLIANNKAYSAQYELDSLSRLIDIMEGVESITFCKKAMILGNKAFQIISSQLACDQPYTWYDYALQKIDEANQSLASRNFKDAYELAIMIQSKIPLNLHNSQTHTIRTMLGTLNINIQAQYELFQTHAYKHSMMRHN